MKTKLPKIICFVLCGVVLLSCSAIFAGAKTSKKKSTKPTNPTTATYKTVKVSDSPVYKNAETGFSVVIMDEINLLTDAQEAKLVDDMKPLTQYGNIAFWSTQEPTSNEIEQARLKRRALFDLKSGGIFAINMNVRKLTIQCYGEMESVINDSISRSITDNVKSYATSKDYYTCAKTAYDQMFRKLDGGNISEPMKIAGYIVIASMLGVIIALAIAFSAGFNPLVKNARDTVGVKLKTKGRVNQILALQYVDKTVDHRPPRVSYSSGSSCSSCSSGSSCSSCSSCSSGSSGSSCSSCGSGGSSSF